MRYSRSIVLLVFLWAASPKQSDGQDFKNVKQLVKGADDAFEQGDYKTAIPLYSTLVSNYPKDPLYNYRYGAALLLGGSDKEKPVKYLQFAVSKPDVDPLAYYYYGLALHLNYEFKKAKKYYQKFENLGKAADVKKYEVEDLITQCDNGTTLLKTITDLIVLDKKELHDEDFYKVYDLTEFNGSIYVKTEDFQSDYEKKNDIKGIFFMAKNGDQIYFSRQTSEEGSKDIYVKDRNPDGSWGRARSLGKPINTKSDEDYPFMHPDGQTLYFASKGHNSLGGYDIFVSRKGPDGRWTAPKNLDFAINTPADDYLFITDLKGETAYFSSNRESAQGDVSVYRINMERVPLDFAFVYGTFNSESTKKAKIKVVNAETNAVLGEYSTDENGKYKIKLPNDGTFNFIVDYENSEVTHSGTVEITDRDSFKPLKQTMEVKEQGTEDERLVIKNLVDEEVEESVELSADFLKNKAKLEINKDKYKDRKKKPKLEQGDDAVAAANTGAAAAGAAANSAESAPAQPVDVGKAATNIAAEEKINEVSSTSGPELESAETYTDNTGSSSGGSSNGGSANGSAAIAAGSTSAAVAAGNINNSESGSSNATSGTAGGQSGIVETSGGTTIVGGAAAALNSGSPSDAGKDEISTALATNETAFKTDETIYSAQADLSRQVSSSSSAEASQKRSEASELASSNNPVDKERHGALLLEAEMLDRKAKTADEVTSILEKNSQQSQDLARLSTTYSSQIQNQSDNSVNQKTYTEFAEKADDVTEGRTELADLQAVYAKEYETKSEEARVKRSTANAEAVKVANLENEIKTNESFLVGASGKTEADIKQKIAQFEIDLESASKSFEEADQRALQAEKEAALALMDIDAVNEVIDQSSSDATINSKKSEVKYTNPQEGGSQTQPSSNTEKLALGITSGQGLTAAEYITESASGSSDMAANSASSSSGQAAGAASTTSNGGVADQGRTNSSEAPNSSGSQTTDNTSSSSGGATNSNSSNGTALAAGTAAGAEIASSGSQNDGNQNSQGVNTVQSTSTSSNNQTGAASNPEIRSASAQSTGNAIQSNVTLTNKGEAVGASVAASAKQFEEEGIDQNEALGYYEGDEWGESELAMLPDSTSPEVSAFNKEEINEVITRSDQSLRTLNQTGYNKTYNDRFLDLIEDEGSDYEKALKTYAINESWLLDVEREIAYLEAVQFDVPDEYGNEVRARLATLETMRDNRYSGMEKAKNRVLDLAEGQGTSQDLKKDVDEARLNLLQTLEGTLPVEEELLAEQTQPNNSTSGSSSTESSASVQGAAAGAAGAAAAASGQQGGNDSSAQEQADGQSGTSGSESENSTTTSGAQGYELAATSSNAAGNENSTESGTNATATESSSAASTEQTSSGGSGNTSASQSSASGQETANTESAPSRASNNSERTDGSAGDQSASSSNPGTLGTSASNAGSANNVSSQSRSETARLLGVGGATVAGSTTRETSTDASTASSANNTANSGSSTTQSETTQSAASGNELASNASAQSDNGAQSGAGETGQDRTSEGSGNAASAAGNTTSSSNSDQTTAASSSGNSPTSVGGAASQTVGTTTADNSGRSTSTAANQGNASSEIDFNDPNKTTVTPGEKGNKLATVFAASTKSVEQVVEAKTAASKGQKEVMEAEVLELETDLETNENKLASAKKKERKTLGPQVEQQRIDVADAKNQAEIETYRIEALARAADLILAVEEGEERESEKEVKRAETLKVEAETKFNEAETREAEKARGKKKKRAKAAEVKTMKAEGDRILAKATASEKLAEEMKELEEDVLVAYKNTPETLPNSRKRLSNAEVLVVENSEAFKVYDTKRKEAAVYYENAQKAYVGAENIEKQISADRAKITALNAQKDEEGDIDKINQLQDEITSLEAEVAKNTEEKNRLMKEAEVQYSEYNHRNNEAVRHVKAQGPEIREDLIAYAVELEARGVYDVAPIAGSSLDRTATQDGYTPDEFSRVVRGIDDYPEELKDAIFDMIDFNKSLYSEDNPIPVDTKLPGGVIFKVQIGAFRNPPPEDVFKGFAPVRGENTRPGWVRYTAGLFTSRNQANLKRNEIRALGYEDAFVVAYKDGKRISLTEANQLIADGYTAQTSQTSASSASADNRTATARNVPTPPPGQAIQINEVQGLMYTVQIGAFRTPVQGGELFGISPIVEYQQNTLYKYGSGVYNDRNRAEQARTQILASGVADAFVTAFYNGRRVSMAEAAQIAQQGSNVLAQEAPVSISEGGSQQAAGNIIFRVQVGAYRQEVPVEDAKIILSLSNLGLDVVRTADLTTYTVGRYSSYNDANAIKERVVGQGLRGAFIVAFQGNQRIDVQEAIRILGQ